MTPEEHLEIQPTVVPDDEAIPSEPETEAQTDQPVGPEMKEITIARALNEVKLLTKRILKTAEVSSLVKFQKGETGKQEPANAVDFLSHVQGLQKLIENRAQIKNAISLANAQVLIEVGQYRLTIAAALAMKEGIDAQKMALDKAQRDYRNIKGIVNRANEEAGNKLANLLEQNFGKDKRADANDYEAIAGPFNKANVSQVVDEETLIKNLELYELMIEDFESEVDFALSEANAQVKIKIPV
jgi:hypothetical protein